MTDKPEISVTMEEAINWVRQGKNKAVDKIVNTIYLDPNDNSAFFIQNNLYELHYTVSPSLIHIVYANLNIGVIKGYGPTFIDAFNDFKQSYRKALYESLSQPVKLDPATANIMKDIP